MKVVVASTNPVKINTAKNGFSKMFPGSSVDVIGIHAPSEVSKQPMNDEETLRGAINRTENVSKLASDADYWVGIEAGLHEEHGDFYTVNWIVVKSKEGKIGKGNTGSFGLPRRIADLVRSGKELNDAVEEVFGERHVGQKNGTIGMLTGDVLTRTSYYETAIILALIPFRNPSLYFS